MRTCLLLLLCVIAPSGCVVLERTPFFEELHRIVGPKGEIDPTVGVTVQGNLYPSVRPWIFGDHLVMKLSIENQTPFDFVIDPAGCRIQDEGGNSAKSDALSKLYPIRAYTKSIIEVPFPRNDRMLAGEVLFFLWTLQGDHTIEWQTRLVRNLPRRVETTGSSSSTYDWGTTTYIRR